MNKLKRALKRFALALAVLMNMSGAVAFAAVHETTSTDHFSQNFTCCEGSGNVSYDHNHSVKTTQDWGGGIGADVVLLETGNPLMEDVTAEIRHDFENDETRAYAVVRVNVFEALANR